MSINAEESGGKTFRIRGVPTAWDEARLQSFLAGHVGCVDPVVKSLAIEYKGRSKTATATFGEVKNTTLTGIGTDDATLILDKDFLGLTTLYAPPADEHKVDIVAIPGLGGHAFGSFKEKDGQHMWLRDELPSDLVWEHTNRPMAHVMIYGYESTVPNSNSIQNLEDLATTFRQTLASLMSFRSARRPLILVAHSLGGLVVKQAVVDMARSEQEDIQRITQAIYGIVFFGVPHDGMETSHLIPMVKNSPNRELIGSLSRINSQILTILQREFYRSLGPRGQTEVFCFYETKESETAREDGDGAWHMDGPKVLLVTKSSATRCRPWEDGADHACAIERSHSDMVKFGREDRFCDIALQKIKGLAKRALITGDRLRDSGVKFLVPYLKNRDYVSRSDLLERVQEHLGFGQTLRRQGPRIAIHGLGGTGKTQIAITFVHWIKGHFPDVSVFWVHGGSAELFRKALAEIAEHCQIPRRDDPSLDVGKLVRNWLEDASRGRWVMVIDNADDEQVFFASTTEDADSGVGKQAQSPSRLSDYIPECSHGSILITTRNKKCGTKLVRAQTLAQSLLEVPKMSDTEAQQLLYNVLGDGSQSAATSHLSTKLEHLPLALAQAAAFIQENSTSVEKYIQLLEESDNAFVDQLSESFEAVGRDSETPHAVTNTWIISFEQIQRQDPLASELLSVASFIDYQAIPERFIVHHCSVRGGKMTNREITKALGTLKAFSLVTNTENNAINMHRLVHLVTRKWLAEQNKSTEFGKHALKTMACIFPYGGHASRAICRDYLPHVHALLRNVNASVQTGTPQYATLMCHMSAYYEYRGYWLEAEEFAKRAIALQTRFLGKEHNVTLKSAGMLAWVYIKRQRLAEAEQILQPALDIRKRVYGENWDTMKCMYDLGTLRLEQKRLTEAEDLASQVLEWYQRQGLDDDQLKLSATKNLGFALMLRGRYDEAKELQLREVETRVKLLGDRHPNTLASIRNLARTYEELGEWEEVERLLSQVTDIYKQDLGEEHPDTLRAIVELAGAYRKLGRLEDAGNMLTQVRPKLPRALGEGHPDILIALELLATTYFLQGRLDEAEELQMWLVEKSSKTVGKEHPDTLTSMFNLALTWKKRGKREDAIRMMRDCVRGSERSLGPDHQHTIGAGSTLEEWEKDSLETSEPGDVQDTLEGSELKGSAREENAQEENAREENAINEEPKSLANTEIGDATSSIAIRQHFRLGN